MESCAKKFKFDLNSTTFIDMNNDCIDEIFRWLSLDDLSSISVTCMQIQRMAGEWFQRKFPENQIGIRLLNTGIEQENSEKYQENLIKFIQNVKVAGHIRGTAPKNLFKYLKVNCCENLRDLEFYWINFDKNVQYDNLIENQLENVERIAFISCSIHDLYGVFLRHCHNLKHLMVNDAFAPLQEHFDVTWMKRSLPHLECLTYYIDHELFRDNLECFLRINPQIKSLACSGSNVMQTVFQRSLTLNHLSLRFYNDNEFQNISSQLRDCSAKMLQIIFDNPVSIETVYRLASVGIFESLGILHFTYLTDYHSENHLTLILKSLKNLKILYLKFDNLSSKDIESISMESVHLKEIYLHQYLGNPFRIFRSNGFCGVLRTFVENSKRLETIVIYGLTKNNCDELITIDPHLINDLIDLNEKRKQIKASAITIYLDYNFLKESQLNVFAEHFIRFRPISEMKRHRFSNESFQFV